MHIHNPTDEVIETMYASRPFIFAPEKTLVVEDKATANHIINEWGTRGLVTLDFGDDTKKVSGGQTVMEVKAAAGRKANTDFRRQMVINHNQMNESNKHTRKPYINPTDQLLSYAAAEGIKLIKPYEVDDIQQQEMNKLDAENRELKGMIKDQGSQISELLGLMKGGGLQAPATKSPEEIKAEDGAKELQAKIDKVNSFKRKDYFEKWLKDSKEVIALWPEEAKTELRKKYTAIIGGELKI